MLLARSPLPLFVCALQVSLVQPLSCVGLAGLALYSHAFVGDRLGAREWAGVALALLGTVALGAGARGLGDRDAAPSVRRAVVGLLLATLVALAVARPPRRSPSPRRSTACLGLASGVCLGLSANLSRCGMLLARRPRRIAGMAVAARGRGHPAASAAWGAVGVAGAAAAAAVALALQTAGLKRGSAVVVCTCASAAGTLFGAAVGKLALGEPLFAGDPVASSLAWLLIGLAVLLLADAGSGAGLPQVGGHVAAKRGPAFASPPRERKHIVKRAP